MVRTAIRHARILRVRFRLQMRSVRSGIAQWIHYYNPLSRVPKALRRMMLLSLAVSIAAACTTGLPPGVNFLVALCVFNATFWPIFIIWAIYTKKES